MAGTHSASGDSRDDGEPHRLEAAVVPKVAIGACLGRYRVLAHLGSGGMGDVYEGHDPELDRSVALKVIQADFDGISSVARARFQREGQAMARLSHPNVVAVYDVGTLGDNLFVAMELVRGPTLAQWIAAGPHDWREVVDVFLQAGRGLQAAHDAGIVHRDFKPRNVILGDRARVVDFGLARAFDDVDRGRSPATHLAQTVTRTGAPAGTPAYMPPEQREGRSVTAQADQYAFCVAMTEALQGGRAPRWIATVLERGRNDDPARRYPSMRSLLADLGRDRRRALRWVALALVAGGAAVAVLALRPARSWQPRVVELPSYFENSDWAALSPDGTEYAYMSNREHPGRFRIYVAALAGGAPRVVTPADMSATFPRYQRDGRALLFRDDDSDRAYRVSLTDERAPEILAEGANWIDDCGGSLLIGYASSPGCGRCERLALRDPHGHERDLVRFPAGARTLFSRCDRAGRRAVYSLVEKPTFGPHEPSDLWVLPLDDGVPRRLTTDRSGNHGTFAPDGRSIVFGSTRSGQWHLWEIPADGSGEPVQRTFGGGWEGGPDISADGRLLLYNVDVTTVQIYAEPLDGAPARQLTSSAQDLRFPLLTPDGRAIIAEATSTTLRSSVVSVPTSGGDPVELFEGGTPALTPDGAEIVYRDGGAGRLLARPRSGGPARTVSEVPGRTVVLVVGPDGRVHAAIARPEGWEAWSAPIQGGPAERELPAPWGLLLPAPQGGWRAAIEWRGAERRVRFLPPGAVLDAVAPSRDLVVTGGGTQAWMPDGRSFLYVANRRDVHRFFVESGEDRVILQSGLLAEFAVSADGKTLYATQYLAHVRRELITNFAER